MNRILLAAALGTSLLTGACQTTGTPVGGSSMQVAGATLPPYGFVEFCKRHPDDCAPSRRSAEPVRLGSTRWDQLRRVNVDVNRSIRYVADPSGAGGDRERWDYPTEAGDCEDFALEKRRRLVEEGWPEQSLLIAIAVVPQVGPHAVLVAVTEAGDYVLDVRSSIVRRWEEVGYRWIKRQSPQDPRRWVAIRSA